MLGSKTARVAAVCALVLAGGVASGQDGDDDPERILTIPGHDAGPIRDTFMFMSGFEPGEGWGLGLADTSPPTGWGVLGGNVSPTISNLNPWIGSQHLHIERDPGLAANSDIGVLSPHIKLPEEMELFTLKMGVYISEKGGADYDVFLQSESQLAARVKFDFTGDIYVVDDLSFRNTGHEWTHGEWKELRIDIVYDDGGDTVANYYYGGVLIYTDNNRFDLADDPTQFGIVGDNQNEDDFGDFDSVMMIVPAPGPAVTALVGALVLSSRRRR